MKNILRNSNFGFTKWCVVLIAALMTFATMEVNAANISFTSTSGSTWLTAGNWSGGSIPSLSDVAQFGVYPSSGIGFNANTTANNTIQAIEILSTRAGNLIVGNSTTTAGKILNLTFNGTSINSVANVIVRNNSAYTLTLQDIASTGTQTSVYVLGNSTDNVLQIDGAGGVTISSVISGASKKLTISGAGAGVVTFSGVNTYSGDTTVNNKLTLSGSGSIANSPNIILASGSTFNVSGLTSPLFLGSTQALRVSATGSSSTATLTVATSKNATLSAGGMLFTAYGGGTTAPLTVTGATAGALVVSGAPVTVTTTTALTAGAYKLVTKSGSATGVTGTPGALTVNGSGLASNTSGALSVSGGELILTVTNNTTAPQAPTIVTITPGDSQLSVAFTAPASNGGAAISGYKWSVDGVNYTTRAGTDSPIVITGLTNGTDYTVRIRAVNSVGDGAIATASSPITAGVPQNPTVIISWMSGPLSTTYGTPSGERTFTVSGSVLSGDLRVTAPADLEVSTTSGENFADFITLTADGGTVSTRTIYVRLKATAAAGTYDNLLISVTEGGDNKSVSTSTGNSVSKAPLTIKGISIVSRDYNKGIDATITGTAQYDGLKNGDTFPVSGTASATFLNQNAGANKNVTVTGYTAPNNNYTLTQPSPTGTINPKSLSITAPTISPRAFDGTTTAGAVSVGTLSGFMGDETVTAIATATAYSSANVGSYSTTVTYLLANGSNGGLAANYGLAGGTATGEITKATPVITFPTLSTNQRAGDVAFAAGATVSPAGAVLSYSSSNPSVAAVDASGNITPLAAGESIITVSVAGDGNLNAASTTQTLRLLGSNGTRSTIFSENIGAPTVNPTLIADNIFQNSGVLNYGNGDQANPADARNSSASTGAYIGASGSGNIFFTSTSGAYGFSIEGINASGYRSIELSYAYRKEGAAFAAFSVDYWNGTSWVTVANTAANLFNETSSAATGWYQAKTLSLPVAAQINGLKIRFVKTGSGTNVRIDDVSLTGLPAAPGITATGSFSAVSTTYGSASAASTDTVTVTGGSLSANIIATPSNSAFEVSTNGSTWANNVTFTQSGGFVTGSLFLRLKPNAPAGTYSDPTVALTSGSASANVAISASTVNPFAITVTAVAANKIYGNSDPQLTYSISPALLFSDTLTGSLERVSGSNAGTYAIGVGSLTNENYAITFIPADFTVQQRPLTITASPDSKIAGLALTSPQTESTKFTQTGLAPGESVSSVTLTYDATAAAAEAPAANYVGAIVPSDPVGINTNNYDITFVAGTLTVDASPTLTLGKTDLPGFETTTYGSESTTQSFAVMGGNLAANVTVSAPSGFVISTNAETGFTTGLTLTPMAGIVSTTIFVKVPGTAGAGSRSGIISLESSGATSRNVTIASSTVLPKPLTIGGLEASNRVYDATTNGTVTGAPVYEGLINNDTFTVNDMVTWSFADKNVGVAKPLSSSVNYTNPSANYIVTQPTFSANITKATLSLASAAAVSRPYAPGNTAVEITGTLNGVQGSDTVSFTGTGTIGRANAGTGFPVTAAVVHTGIDSSNYDFNQPTGLTVDITRANQTITFNAPANATVGTPTDIGATASSGLAVTFTSSNSNVATISGGSVVAVAPGVTTITASQAGDSNYLAATSVSQILNVGNVLNFSGFIAGWDFQTTVNGGTAAAALPNSPTNFVANFGNGTIHLDGSNGSTLWSTATELSGFNGATGSANAGTGFSTVTTGVGSLGLQNSTANNKRIIFKFSMSGLKSLSVSYATQRSGTSFTTQVWEASVDGTTWTAIQTVSTIPTAFGVITLNPISILDNATECFLRLTLSGATGSSGNNRLDNIQLFALGEDTPAITPSGAFGSLSTTYGSASDSSEPVLVSGGSLAANIIATAPTGFELSADGSTWNSSVTFPQTAGFASGNLYVRLGTTTPAGTQVSPLVTLSAGSASQTVTIGTTTVSPKTVTVTGAAVSSKDYDGTQTATITGTLDGVISPDVVTLVGSGTFVSANAGTGIAVTSTSTLGGAAAGNYILTQPTGLTGTINKSTPVLGSIPTTSAITTGQALSNSNISGGTVTPSGGTWAWSDPGNTNTVEGTNSYAAVYTPALADQGNYLNLTNDLSVTVNSAGPVGTTYSGWLISNGANGSDAAFLDYVFGAVAPGTLDPSLKPTVAVAGGNLVLTYYVRQGTAGLTVTPKTSADLAAAPGDWVNVIPVDVDVAREVNGIFVQQKTASVPVSGDRKFLKLEVLQE